MCILVLTLPSPMQFNKLYFMQWARVQLRFHSLSLGKTFILQQLSSESKKNDRIKSTTLHVSLLWAISMHVP